MTTPQQRLSEIEAQEKELAAEKTKPTITLTNKNLSGSECTNCVFNGKETPKSIAVGG